MAQCSRKDPVDVEPKQELIVSSPASFPGARRCLRVEHPQQIPHGAVGVVHDLRGLATGDEIVVIGIGGEPYRDRVEWVALVDAT
jgi:hypothetical protein